MLPEATIVTSPEVMSAMCHVRKYRLRMRNRKLHNIRPSGTFFIGSNSHVTGRDPVRKRSWPEVCSAHARFSPRFFLSSNTVVTWLPDVIKGHLTPCVCACATGSCTSPVVTEGHVTPSEVVSLGCSLRRPRPIFSMVTGIGGSLPEVTSVTWPEVTSVAGIECMFCACSVFSRFFS